MAGIAALTLALCASAAPAFAGRITQGWDAGFELARIVSEHAGGTSETIAPDETVPDAPIYGKTVFFGTSQLFAEFAKVSVWNGLNWVPVTGFTFEQDGVPNTGLRYVTFTFDAQQVQALYNRWVRFELYPMPRTGGNGDTVEMVYVTRGHP
jgi:hypothetical protein